MNISAQYDCVSPEKPVALFLRWAFFSPTCIWPKRPYSEKDWGRKDMGFEAAQQRPGPPTAVEILSFHSTIYAAPVQ